MPVKKQSAQPAKAQRPSKPQAVPRARPARDLNKLIEEAAYYRAQQRGFAPGHELDDWVAAAAKHGVAGLTKLLANEWAPKGINVNAIAPGYVRTEATQALQEDPVRNERLLSRIPAGRWGESSDIGGAAVFLSSRASDYCHGTILVVDGGWLAG